MARGSTPGQTGLWNCPNCGQLWSIEDTGEKVRSRHYGTSKIMIFRDPATGEERKRCACRKALHWLFNGDRQPFLFGAAR